MCRTTAMVIKTRNEIDRNKITLLGRKDDFRNVSRPYNASIVVDVVEVVVGSGILREMRVW